MTTSVITPEEIIQKGKKVFEKTENMTDATLSYCPGCGHGVVHRICVYLPR